MASRTKGTLKHARLTYVNPIERGDSQIQPVSSSTNELGEDRFYHITSGAMFQLEAYMRSVGVQGVRGKWADLSKQTCNYLEFSCYIGTVDG